MITTFSVLIRSSQQVLKLHQNVIYAISLDDHSRKGICNRFHYPCSNYENAYDP